MNEPDFAHWLDNYSASDTEPPPRQTVTAFDLDTEWRLRSTDPATLDAFEYWTYTARMRPRGMPDFLFQPYSRRYAAEQARLHPQTGRERLQHMMEKTQRAQALLATVEDGDDLPGY